MLDHEDIQVLFHCHCGRATPLTRAVAGMERNAYECAHCGDITRRIQRPAELTANGFLMPGAVQVQVFPKTKPQR